VIDETRALFHRLRLAAEQLHATERLPAGERAVLIELAAEGPRTVPDMAQARPVSRQHIQTLVNALMKRGLVRLIENPRHQRSKLVELTRVGSALAKTVRSREEKTLAQLGRELDSAELEQAAETLGHVRELFAGDRFQHSLKLRGTSRRERR
jgi:DNA-binding MarR family transcriptional regulator